MNEVIRQLLARKSTLAFTEQDITPEEKAAILQAAVNAPTAGNQQLYTILDITDPALKERLAVTCDNQPFIAQAKMILIFCADCKKWQDAFSTAGCTPRKPAVGDLLLAVSDANIAATNRAQLQPSTKLAPSFDSGNIRSSTAAPIIPVTTGRIPALTPFT